MLPPHWPEHWIYHITTEIAWEAAQPVGQYIHPSLETEGFIHCSYPDQVIETARVHFQGQSGLVLLCIDSSQLQAELKAEVSRNGAAFPHLYGALNAAAVVETVPFAPPPLETVLEALLARP